MCRDGRLPKASISLFRKDRSWSRVTTWDGNLNLLRLDPLADGDAAAGRSFEIDYVRLLEGSAIIPEPSDALLTMLGGFLFFARRRR